MTHAQNPTAPAGYRLPGGIRERLENALGSSRTAADAVRLAEFVARHWSLPTRLVAGFALCRRGLATRADLGLTEARIRRAIELLEMIGFIERQVETGSTHRATVHGLRKKPIVWRIASEYGTQFAEEHARRRPTERRRPKYTPADTRVHLGPVVVDAESPLEKAIGKWMVALGGAASSSSSPPDFFGPTLVPQLTNERPRDR